MLPDPLYPPVTLFVLGILAGVTYGWRRGLLRDAPFVAAGVPAIALAILLVSPLYGYWLDLMNDETGWFFLMELFVTLLVVPLSIGLAYAALMLASATRNVLRSRLGPPAR